MGKGGEGAREDRERAKWREREERSGTRGGEGRE